ncbi:hypothetical protein D3C86_2143980 [compost metagenome]
MAAHGGFERTFFLLDRGLFQRDEGWGFIDFQADENRDHHQYETHEERESPAEAFELFAGKCRGQAHQYAVG